MGMRRKLIRGVCDTFFIGSVTLGTIAYECHMFDAFPQEESKSDLALASNSDHLPHTHGPDYSPAPFGEYASVTSGSSYDLSAGSGLQLHLPGSSDGPEWV
jgi:hypothetical protein